MGEMSFMVSNCGTPFNLTFKRFDMSRRAIVEDCAVAGDESQIKRAGGGDQDAVHRVIVNFAGQIAGTHQYLSRQLTFFPLRPDEGLIEKIERLTCRRYPVL